MSGRLALAVALLVAAPLGAQRGSEWQAGGVATVSDVPYMGGGLGYARRASRVRLGVNLSGGVRDAEPAGRGEVLLGYMLMPGRRDGVTVYAAGGVAADVTENALVERVVALLGIEGTPGGRRGWYVELGVGGGIRLAAGYRFRRLRR